MNNQRRKRLENLAAKMEDLIGDLIGLRTELETVRDDETDYLENVPENMQGGEKYQISETALDNIENAINALESLEDDATNIIDTLTEAAE